MCPINISSTDNLPFTVRFGCFSLMNDYQRSAGGNLNIGTCKGCEI